MSKFGKKGEKSEWQKRFSSTFTGEDMGLKRGKKPETEEEAAERRRKMNERFKSTGK